MMKINLSKNIANLPILTHVYNIVYSDYCLLLFTTTARPQQDLC